MERFDKAIMSMKCTALTHKRRAMVTFLPLFHIAIKNYRKLGGEHRTQFITAPYIIDDPIFDTQLSCTFHRPLLLHRQAKKKKKLILDELVSFQLLLAHLGSLRRECAVFIFDRHHFIRAF